jgi:hypothetical protein
VPAVASEDRAAAELVAALFLVIDEDTEEVLIRSFLKHDGLLHKPNVTKAMVSAFTRISSPLIRGVIVHELTRLHERYPEWNGFGVEGVSDILSRGSINPREQVDTDDEKGSGKGSGKGSEVDASLLTPNSLLPAPYNLHPATSEIAAAIPRPDVAEVLDHLDKRIAENGAKLPVRNKSNMDAARLLLDKDGRTLEQVHAAIEWATNDGFWRANILSMSKLRENYDQLRLQAQRSRATPGANLDQNMSMLDGIRAREAHDEGI